MNYLLETSTFEALPPFIPERTVNSPLQGVGRSEDWKCASSPTTAALINKKTARAIALTV
ncbi:hypothetical protein [Brevibacillus brevis]|uniref:hypothetical protein n=1 Tax=Brevibacillus brevis TaxID=1393 RepID=UPI001476C764|nr:hypothetical protein [Brevibacillus brevis]